MMNDFYRRRLTDYIAGLRQAERVGRPLETLTTANVASLGVVDEPEGRFTIQLSHTLAEQIADDMEALLNYDSL